jgi:hypothetical protein
MPQVQYLSDSIFQIQKDSIQLREVERTNKNVKHYREN